MIREKITYEFYGLTGIARETETKTETIDFNLEGRRIRVPVDAAVKAHFKDQFDRPAPTPLQKKRYTTLMNLLRAAYRKGFDDGKAT